MKDIATAAINLGYALLAWLAAADGALAEGRLENARNFVEAALQPLEPKMIEKDNWPPSERRFFGCLEKLQAAKRCRLDTDVGWLGEESTRATDVDKYAVSLRIRMLTQPAYDLSDIAGQQSEIRVPADQQFFDRFPPDIIRGWNLDRYDDEAKRADRYYPGVTRIHAGAMVLFFQNQVRRYCFAAAADGRDKSPC